MTVPKTPPAQRPVPLAAQFLKLVGILLILSFFGDWIVLLIAPQFQNVQWQINLLTQFVDRGVTPLIAFVLIYVGFWIQGVAGAKPETEAGAPAWKDWRFWVFVVSSLLGLLFLLTIPLLVATTGQLTDQALTQLKQQAAQSEINIDREEKQLKALASSGQIPEILKNDQLPAEQRALLQQLQQDPQAIEKQYGQVREQIRSKQKEASDQIQTEALVNRIRYGLRAFLLAIGFITIGWSGLRESR
ncbi:HpsJ family protein [Thermosynechococcaceae cyanobacterium BACA0444]|uniref:HpsJ family protein n=1 Tax=Pseudocalidococcus azoricus BACA0444 TaxID=2918990 RepID=A0AAE4JZ02_9CYAN|nr:HpsJ family protein [Pseudocalidococcus azoricus]MDS3861569.1 HpsJ family protein [Pseudocalidococcus azoricus BACA0444]